MTLAYVGLGANLGAPRDTIERAIGELGRIRGTRLRARSSLWRSAPLGYAEQPEFINAVAALDTALGAQELFLELRAIERSHGRSRSFRNAPRTLDLDLLLYGEAILAAEGLTLPHPRMHERAFVLAPLLELDPAASVPGRGSAAQLLAACAAQRIERL